VAIPLLPLEKGAKFAGWLAIIYTYSLHPAGSGPGQILQPSLTEKNRQGGGRPLYVLHLQNDFAADISQLSLQK
jgi:hypothetical protein